MGWPRCFFLTRHGTPILITETDVSQIWRPPQMGRFLWPKFMTYIPIFAKETRQHWCIYGVMIHKVFQWSSWGRKIGMWMSVSQQSQGSLYVLSPSFTVASRFCLFFGALNLEDTWAIHSLSLEALGRCKACHTAAHFTRWVASYFLCPNVCKKTLARWKAAGQNRMLLCQTFWACLKIRDSKYPSFDVCEKPMGLQVNSLCLGTLGQTMKNRKHPTL